MNTRTAVRAATSVALLAVLATACGGTSDSSSPSPKESHAAAAGKDDRKPTVDCSDESLSQADWVKHCADGAGTGGDGTTAAKTLQWGEAAGTVGAQAPASGPGGGDLDVTPTTVLYAKDAMGSTSVNGLFAIITVKDRATGKGAATESAPLEGGGWKWIAPGGQALDEGENGASNITPNGFTGGGMVQGGTWAWRTIAFDLSEAQKGGTLAYTDGAGSVFRWKAPATDSGPELAKLKKGMEGNY